MARDGPPPMLGADTIRNQAATSEQAWEAQREARQQTAERFETQRPEEVDVRRQPGGRFAASDEFFRRAEPEEAAFQFDRQFERQDITPDDVRRTDDGFQPRERVERQAAAFEFEDQFDVFGTGELDPESDIREAPGGGFGLGRDAVAVVGAAEIDSQLPGIDVGPDDVDVEERSDGTFDVGFEGWR